MKQNRMRLTTFITPLPNSEIQRVITILTTYIIRERSTYIIRERFQDKRKIPRIDSFHPHLFSRLTSSLARGNKLTIKNQKEMNDNYEYHWS